MKAKPGDIVTITIVGVHNRPTDDSITMLVPCHDSPHPQARDIGSVLEGTQVLYVSTVVDERSQEQVKNNTRPFGFAPMLKHWHLVLWKGRPVWISSPNVELVPVNA